MEIDILNDTVAAEPNEQFALRFTVHHPRVQTGTVTSSTVTIIDDDEGRPLLFLSLTSTSKSFND